jgi:hypothetical protein
MEEHTRNLIQGAVQKADRAAEELAAEHGEPAKVHRVPVDFRYDAINPTFLRMLAVIGHYAAGRYGSCEQYANARLTGEKGPVNHIYEHLRQYQMGEKHDHFDGDPRWHLAAIAYNAMMEYFYASKWGVEKHFTAARVPLSSVLSHEIVETAEFDACQHICYFPAAPCDCPCRSCIARRGLWHAVGVGPEGKELSNLISQINRADCEEKYGLNKKAKQATVPEPDDSGATLPPPAKKTKAAAASPRRASRPRRKVARSGA